MMRRLLLLLPLCALIPLLPRAGAEETATLQEIRVWNAPDHTRLVFDLSSRTRYEVFSLARPERLVIDLRKVAFQGRLPPRSKYGPYVERFRGGQPKPGVTRFVLDLKQPVRHTVEMLDPVAGRPYRLVVDIAPRSKWSPPPTPAKPPAARGDLVIVIDPGHGGEDPGALGSRTKEKNVVLKIARRLKKKIDAVPGLRAYLTRDGDYYISLRRRIAIAREKNADLFISIHADAHPNRKARGASVYALSQHGATSELARWLADKENAADLIGGVTLEDKDDLLAQILLDMSMDKTIEFSIRFGGAVLSELKRVGRVHSRRVEQAGFVVLKSPDIPSILVETAYITNPGEEKLLRSRRYQEKLAGAILRGIRRYEPILKRRYARN